MGENPGKFIGFCRFGEVSAEINAEARRYRLFAGLGGLPVCLKGSTHLGQGRAAIVFALAREPRLVRPEARDPGPDLGLHIDRRLGRRDLDRLGGG
jgi:hypothetical protein